MAFLDTTTPLEPGGYYHIFNRGNNRDDIFYYPGNYPYFLRRYDHYLSNYLGTYCFCLLSNHFFLLVRIKPEAFVLQHANRRKFNGSASQIVSERLRRFFLSYSKSINKQTGRTGSLFQKPFRRKKVNEERYFTSLVAYIHYNPERHRVHFDYTRYPWSSYAAILSDLPTKLMRQELLDWFGGPDRYVDFHRNSVPKGAKHLMIE